MTRKRRILIFAAVLAACVGIALGALAMLPSRPIHPGITQANFDRINIGTTRGEVERLFGRPAMWSEPHPQNEALCIDLWFVISEVEACIIFENDIVVQMRWDGPQDPPPDKLRRWLYLPK